MKISIELPDTAAFIPLDQKYPKPHSAEYGLAAYSDLRELAKSAQRLAQTGFKP